MKKGLLGGIIAVFVLVAIVGYLLVRQKGVGKTDVVHGYSTRSTEIEAVDEAVKMVKTKITEPDYIILFSTVGYNSEKILAEVNKLLPNTKVYGGTSMLGVVTKDGWHQGETGSLAMMAVSSSQITFGVGGATLSEYNSAQEAGNAAIQNAIKDAGREGSYPQLVLITSAPGNEEMLIKGIEEIVGWGIPIIGGSSADNDLSGKWKQFVNDKVYSQGVSLTAIFTDLTVAHSFESGYNITDKKGTITKAKGRVIYELDGKPAAEVYNEWCGGCVAKKLETGGSIVTETATIFWPLAKVIESKIGTYHLSIHPIAIGPDDKSLTVFANVTDGDKVLLVNAKWEMLLNRAKTTPEKAVSAMNVTRDKLVMGIYTYCAGTMLTVPPAERPQIPLLVSKTIGENVPFIGTFTFGEQGPLGVVNHHGNLINSMIVFGEKE